MKKLKKSAILCLLFILIIGVISGASASAFAAESSVKESQSDSALPSSFDLRSVDTDGDGIGDRCYVTPVKAQQPFGVCWSFAAIAAAETSLLGSVYEDDPDAYKTLDLSEKQVAYYAHMYIDDPSSPQYGEGMHTDEYHNASDIYGGGSAYLATNIFATGIGPVNESRKEIFEYHGKNREITQKQSAAGLVTCYSPDDDWSMDDSCRYQRDYILKESYLLETPAQFVVDLQKMTSEYVYNEDATNAIKEQLLLRRGVEIGFHADTSLPWQTGGEGDYMNAETWAHYTWDAPIANHAVTIVGWDDHYSASNFLSGHQPPGDGAWLVKNSWGSGTNEFPDQGTGQWGIPVQKTDENGDPVYDDNGDPVMVGSGYFWLSYYDRTIKDPEVFLFDTQWGYAALGEEAMDSIHVDQHDLMPVGGIYPAFTETETKAANIFTPEDGEHVLYVSYIAKEPNTTVSYEVYLLAPDYTSPEDGILMASGEETHELGGYYMAELNPFVTVEKGQSYSVIVTQKTDKGKYAVNTPSNNGKNGPKLPDEIAEMAGDQYAVAVVNEGESMLYTDGEWLDWSKEESREKLFGPMYSYIRTELDSQYDNFPIKGYAVDKMITGDLRFSGNMEKLTLCEGATENLSLELSGEDDGIELGDFDIEWGLSTGGEEIVDVTISAGSKEATVTAVKPGIAYLIASAESAGAVILPIEVQARKLGDVDADGSVTILDVTGIQKRLASVPLSYAFSEKAADTDEDGIVSVLDATNIQRWLVNLPSSEKIGKPMS